MTALTCKTADGNSYDEQKMFIFLLFTFAQVISKNRNCFELPDTNLWGDEALASRQVTLKNSLNGLLCCPASCLTPPPLSPACLLRDVRCSQESACDRSAVAPASCSLWPCCEQSVMSCLSLCLFLALPEGPRGTDCGSDGSTADPSGYGSPGPGPVYLSASASGTDNRHSGPWSFSRVPGLFPSPTRHFSSTIASTPNSSAARRPAISKVQPAPPKPTISLRHTTGQRGSHMSTHNHTHAFTLVDA